VAVRDVLLYPDERLKRICEALGDLDRARAVAADLFDTMATFPRCVGIAAPQVGELVRLCIVDCSEHPKAATHHGRLVLVNPVVVEDEGGEVGREGCLSIPDLTANVRRATRAVVEARRLDGSALRIDAVGFEARALLHEIDHLDGMLFLDRVASLTDDVFRRKSYG
jgi:peptide deformylase